MNLTEDGILKLPPYSTVDLGVIIAANETIRTVTVTVSTVGLFLSTLSLLLLLLTAFRFAEWRQSYKNQLLIQLMIARFLYTIIRYSIDISDAFEVCQCHLRRFINARVFFLYYSELALVFWMYVFTRQMYKSLVKVFDVSDHNIIRVSAITWFLPLVITTFCVYIPFKFRPEYLKVYTIALFLIKWPLMIANAILLILIIRSLVANNKNRAQKNLRIILVIILLIISLSLQQLILDSSKIMIFTYSLKDQHFPEAVTYVAVTYNIFSLYYCAFTICFWVFGNANTRRLWREGKQAKKPGVAPSYSVPGPSVPSRPLSEPAKRQVSKHPEIKKHLV